MKMDKGKTIKCDFCGAKLSSKRALMEHFRYKCQYRGVSQKCAICDYECNNVKTMNKHVRRSHKLTDVK